MQENSMAHEAVVKRRESHQGAPLVRALALMGQLESAGVQTVLFGSLGASMYLGDFKSFGDVDLLIEQKWLEEDWASLQEIMRALGFVLGDEREHEFQHSGDGMVVGFAGMNIFERDSIVFDKEKDVVVLEVNGQRLKTFTPDLFKRTYEYSAKDGYRRERRNKKDRQVLDLLTSYIEMR